MPEPLKNLYNTDLIARLCGILLSHHAKFNTKDFTQSVFDQTWEDKELKQRMAHISVCLHDYLPPEYPQAIEILKKISVELEGFEYMFFPGFVELYGLDDYQTSIDALEHFTQYSSSEFAVRPFILKYRTRMIDQLKVWAKSSNHHVRRLASEGSRPRLPWARALAIFKQEPLPILPILEMLKNDESQYVRRSVANNLNDISKDNPDVVIQIAKNWLGDNQNTNWIVKHACRTMLKKGDPEVMSIFGFVKPNHLKVIDFRVQDSVIEGGKLNFSFKIQALEGELDKLRIEYAIDYLKKNGELSRKIFQISESLNTGQEKSINKSHSFRRVSTRVHYLGTHGIAVICNGVELAQKKFTLQPVT